MVQIRIRCPGCGEYTAPEHAPSVLSTPLKGGGVHLFTVKDGVSALWIFCPVTGAWYCQTSYLNPQEILPEGQQLGLL